MKQNITLLLPFLLIALVSRADKPKKISVRNSQCMADRSGCGYALVYKNDSGMRLDFYDCRGKISISRNYTSNLRPKKDWLCKSAKLHGEEIVYDTSGNVRARNLYFHGKLSGKATTYHSNGKTDCAGNYQAGVKHGLFETFNTAGQLISSLTYRYGLPYQGSWKESYRNGFTCVVFYNAGKHIRTVVLKQSGDTSSVYWFRYEHKERLVSAMHIYKENRFSHIRPFGLNYRDSFFMKSEHDSSKNSVADTINNREISFIGGTTALENHIVDYTEYPESARMAGKKGIVIVNMLFGMEGFLLDVFSRSEADPSLVKEAVKVIQGTDGCWLYALYNGNPVLSRARIPITFEIED